MSRIERLPQEPAWWRDTSQDATFRRRDVIVAFRVEDLERGTTQLRELLAAKPTATSAVAELLARQWSVTWLTALGLSQTIYYPTGEQTQDAVEAGKEAAEAAQDYARKLPASVLDPAIHLAQRAINPDEED